MNDDGFIYLEVPVEGMGPMLMHNSQLADPRNFYTKKIKEITSKRKKTDEDHEQLSYLEWHGGLYTNNESGEVPNDAQLIIPERVVNGVLSTAAKKHRLGTLFKSAVMCVSVSPFDIGREYTIDELWESDEFISVQRVNVGGRSVMRTRPQFNEWRFKYILRVDPDQVDLADVHKVVCDSVKYTGFGDYAPQYGRFILDGDIQEVRNPFEKKMPKRAKAKSKAKAAA